MLKKILNDDKTAATATSIQSASVTSQHANQLEPLFYASSPLTIKYAEKPPRIDPAYKEIPVDEFAKQHNFTWSDACVATPKVRDAIWQSQKYPRNAYSLIDECLHNPLTSLVVCEIDKTVGKGVFLALDAKPIRAGTVTAVYVGEIIDLILQKAKHINALYKMSLRTDEHKHSVVNELIHLPSVYGDETGNIARFYMDLPSEIGAAMQANKGAKGLEKIATANHFVYPTVYKGVPVCFLIAIRDIQPGEQLGFDYEEAYQMEKRCVFNSDGQIIGHFAANNKLIFDSEKVKQSKVAPRMDMRYVQTLARSLIKPIYNTFDHKKQFIGDVSYILSIYKKRFIQDTLASIYIQQLETYLALNLSANDLLSAIVTTSQSSEHRIARKILDNMQTELIECVITYTNRNKTNTKINYADLVNQLRLGHQSDMPQSSATLFDASKTAILNNIPDELNRIFPAKTSWKYSKTKEIACIEMEDENLLTALNEHLTLHGNMTQQGKNKKTNMPLLYIHKPVFDKLKNTPALKAIAATAAAAPTVATANK